MVVGGQNHGTREQFAVNGYLNCKKKNLWDIEEALFELGQMIGRGEFNQYESSLASSWLSVFGQCIMQILMLVSIITMVVVLEQNKIWK